MKLLRLLLLSTALVLTSQVAQAMVVNPSSGDSDDILYRDLNPSSPSKVTEVPVPAAFWLFGTALMCFIGVSRRTRV